MTIPSVPPTPKPSVNKITQRTIETIPSLAAAAYQMPLSKDDNANLTQIAGLMSKHKELVALDDAKAQREFSRLDPNIQTAMKSLWGNASYVPKEEDNSIDASDLFRMGGNILKSPFRALFKGVEEYTRAIRFAPDVIGGLATGGLEFKDLMKGKTWQEMWDGRSMFDRRGIEELTKVHGHASVYIASKLLSGASLGEIVDSYGPIDKDFETAFANALDPDSGFKDIMDQVQSTHMDIGRELMRSMYNVKSSYGLSSFQRKAFSKEAQTMNLVYEIALDPLTYLSAGTVNIAKYGIKGARVIKANEALLKMQEVAGPDIVRIMEMPGVKEYWDNLGSSVKSLKDARAAEDSVRAGQVRQEISKKFWLFDSDEKLKILTDANIFNHQDAIRYFGDASSESLQNYYNITHGRINGTTFYADGALIARQYRLGSSRIADDVMKSFGLRKQATAEEMSGISSTLKERGFTGKVEPGAFDAIATTDQRAGFINKLTRLFERAPAQGGIIHVDENAYKSVGDFYRIARIILPKAHAKALSEEFLASDMANRFMLIRGLYMGVMQKVGLDHIVGGQEVMQNTIARLGAEGGHFGVQVAEDIPKHFADTLDIVTTDELSKAFQGKILLTTGPVQFNQLRTFVSGLNIPGLKTIFADGKIEAKTSNKMLRIRHIGGMTEKGIVQKFMNNWTFYTLAPQLGIRSAIDEGFMHFLTMPADVLRKLWFGEGRKLSDFEAAFTGDAGKLGMVKEYFRTKMGKSPIQFHEKAKAKAAEQAAAMGFTSAEYREAYKNLLFETVSAKYGRHLSSHQLKDFRSLMMHDPDVVEAMATSALDMLIHAGQVSVEFRHAIAENKSLTALLEKEGIQDIGEFTSKDIAVMAGEHGDNATFIAHMYAVLSRFNNGNAIKIVDEKGKETFVSLTDLIFKHRGMGTAEDFRAAQNEGLSRMGVEAPPGTNLYAFCDKEKAIKILSQYSSTPRIISAINATGVAALGAAGAEKAVSMVAKAAEAADASKAIDLAKPMDLHAQPDDVLIEALKYHLNRSLLDSYIAVHGAADQFNEGFINYVRSASTKNGEFNEIKMHNTFEDMTFDKFKELTASHRIKGTINTPLNFDGAEVKGWYQRFQEKTYEMMDRTVKSVVRSPLTHILYMDERERLRGLQNAHVNAMENEMFQSRVDWLMANNEKMDYGQAIAKAEKARKEGEFLERAERITEKKFTHMAMDSAMNRVLKYSDNPNIKTNLATSIRTMGRFYRATEDFYRRMYRLSTDAGPRAVYRARLMHHGLVSSGFLYTDQNGEEYVAIPGDNIIFSVVDHVMRTFNKDAGVVQPYWNNLTFNISSLNPSFQANAGAPTLAGPLAGVSALAARSILGQFGDKGLQASDNLNSLVLGQFSGNLNFWNAVIPSKLTKLYTTLSGDDKLLQMNSAMIQGICYLTANGQAVGKDGTPIGPDSSPEDIAYFQDNLRKTTHNLLVFRQALGLFSPANPTYRQTVDVPDYIQKNGVTSLRQEFFDILESISKKSEAQQIDPYEQAFALFTKKHPGMAIYTLPREERLTKVALRYTNGMRKWMADNKDMYDKYGEAALIFSPQVGDLDQGSYSFLEMHGFIKSMDYKKFFDKALTAEDKKRYFDLADEADAALAKTADIQERSQIIKNLTIQRQQLIMRNPMLAQAIEPQTGNIGISDEEAIYRNLRDIVRTSSTNIDPAIREKMSYAIYLIDKTLPILQSSNVKGMGDFGSVYRLESRNQALAEIKALCAGDPNLKQAYRMIFEPILTFYAKDTRRARGYVY